MTVNDRKLELGATDDGVKDGESLSPHQKPPLLPNPDWSNPDI